jgi:hypothetical protein
MVLESRGLPRVSSKASSCIRSQNTEWMWLDSLTISGGVEDLSLHEEDPEVSLINCLADRLRIHLPSPFPFAIQHNNTHDSL